MGKIKIQKIPERDIDYVVLYAEELRKNPELFGQQKIFLESQMKSSNSFFKNFIKGGDFKAEARKYLKSRGLI